MKEVKVYEGKTLSELLEQIVKNCEEEKVRAINMYDQIKGECTSAEQMMLIGPVAANYLEIASKQTDNLIKLANTIQKIDAADKANTDPTGLTEIERSELLDHLEKTSADPLSARHDKEAKKRKERKEAHELSEALSFGSDSEES